MTPSSASRKVISLPTATIDAAVTHTHFTFARVHEIVADIDLSNTKPLVPFAEKTKGLHEGIASIDKKCHEIHCELAHVEAVWARHGYPVHWSPLSPALTGVALFLLVVAETVLAGTVLEGLDLTEFGRWTIAAGTAMVTALLSKALATGVKELVDAPTGTRVPRLHMSMVAMGIPFLLVILLGQFFAREAYTTQAMAAGEEGVTTGIATALTLLQAGLALAAAYVVYISLPHLPAHRAQRQVALYRARLADLAVERNKLASPLNAAVATLRAEWAGNQARGRSLIFEYVQELHNSGQDVSQFRLDGTVFLPAPPWVREATDPVAEPPIASPTQPIGLQPTSFSALVSLYPAMGAIASSTL